MTPLLPVLERYWGYTSFRPLQREAMEAVVDGRDSLLVLPTGGGKSICFQAPALIRDGLALVISPLISLMKDQVDTLVANGVPAACLNSAMAADERAAVTAGLREGRYRLLYVAPERIAGEGGGWLSWL
ncbi:MAG: DEAD/DEAH box helicase, partial [Acidobacteriota bacterium]|nr:DEAD/DEAH box helicase [Acidobacteriota bacterium]